MEDQLVEWFKKKFASRTPPKSVLDALPEYRVPWSEILQKMQDLGYTGNAVDLRQEWFRIHEAHKLRPYCNRLLKTAGETQRVRKG
jgi:hypothetical protein